MVHTYQTVIRWWCNLMPIDCALWASAVLDISTVHTDQSEALEQSKQKIWKTMCMVESL